MKIECLAAALCIVRIPPTSVQRPFSYIMARRRRWLAAKPPRAAPPPPPFGWSSSPVSLSLHGGGDAAAPFLPCASARGRGTMRSMVVGVLTVGRRLGSDDILRAKVLVKGQINIQNRLNGRAVSPVCAVLRDAGADAKPVARRFRQEPSCARGDRRRGVDQRHWDQARAKFSFRQSFAQLISVIGRSISTASRQPPGVRAARASAPFRWRAFILGLRRQLWPRPSPIEDGRTFGRPMDCAGQALSVPLLPFANDRGTRPMREMRTIE